MIRRHGGRKGGREWREREGWREMRERGREGWGRGEGVGERWSKEGREKERGKEVCERGGKEIIGIGTYTIEIFLKSCCIQKLMNWYIHL